VNIKQLKRQLAGAVCSVLMALIALSSATYAWYIQNVVVTATDVQVTASVVYNLMIKRVAEGDYSTTCKLNGSRTLTPVSTLGELQTSSGSFSENTYDHSPNSYDKNDVRFAASDTWNSSGVVETFSEVGKNTLALLTDTEQQTAPSKMYYQDSVYLKAGQESQIYFDNNSTGIYNALTKTLTSFPDVTDPETLALMKTMRVGLMVTQQENTASEKHKFFVYQLNRDLIDDGAGSRTTTKDYNDQSVDGISYAAGPFGVGILSFANLVDKKVPLLSDCTADGQSNGLSVTTDKSQALAAVHAGEEVKVDIYLWMEGCDFDTTASNSAQFSTQIEGIQFGFCLGLPEQQP
jgi:hypothetical protein